VLIADVSELSISSIFIDRWMKYEVYFIYLPMKMELIEGSETSAISTVTPGNYPKENILHTEHGESLKSRLISSCVSTIQLMFHIPIHFVHHRHQITLEVGSVVK